MPPTDQGLALKKIYLIQEEKWQTVPEAILVESSLAHQNSSRKMCRPGAVSETFPGAQLCFQLWQLRTSKASSLNGNHWLRSKDNEKRTRIYCSFHFFRTLQNANSSENVRETNHNSQLWQQKLMGTKCTFARLIHLVHSPFTLKHVKEPHCPGCSSFTVLQSSSTEGHQI